MANYPLYLMITIANRPKLPAFMELYKVLGIEASYISLGRGTARGEIAEYLGLTESERSACFSFVTSQTWALAKDKLRGLGIDAPNGGVVFLIPISSVGGKRELAYFTDGQQFEKGDETSMQKTKQELIVVICGQGHSELVMNAAREAGARGGTVFHAVGTGVKEAERFLGVSLGTEKDLIFIVSATESKKQIMSAIMKDAGLDSSAKSVCFSMPVSDTAGINL